MFKQSVRLILNTAVLLAFSSTHFSAVALAQAYKANNSAAALSLARMDSSLNDINNYRKAINSSGDQTRELTYIIRNLINENDALYVMLRKRTTELVELRAKFSKTPYEQEYDALMRDLIPERVPQQTHQANDLLKLLNDQPEPSAANLAAIAAADETQELIRTTIRQKKIISSPVQAQAIQTALDSKSNLLNDKNSLLQEKQKNLEALKSELTRLNESLKTGNTYYQELNTKLTLQNVDQQKQVSELMTDCGKKAVEIRKLKSVIDSTSDVITTAQTGLLAKAAALDALNATLNAKDIEIAQFKTLLLQKDATIQAQAADLNFTNESLNKTGSRLTSIEDLLKENDTDLADLQSRVSRVRSLMQPGTTPSPAATTAATPGKSIFETQAVIIALREENTALKAVNDQRGLFFRDLNDRLDDLALGVSDKTDTLAQQQITLQRLSARTEKLEDQAQTARAELADRNLELRKAQAQLRVLENIVTAKESRAQDSKEKMIELLDENSTQNQEIIRLSTALATQKPALRAADITIVTHNAPAPENTFTTEETRLLHETLAKKDAEIAALKQKISTLIASAEANAVILANNDKAAAQCHDLDLQEKNALIIKLQGTLDEKNAILQQANTESSLLQEKLSILEAKQDAIKGVIQKRDMEFMRISAEADAKTNDLALMTKERDTLMKTLADKDSTVSLTETRLKERENETAALKDQIIKLGTTVNNAHDEIARLNAEIKKLQK